MDNFSFFSNNTIGGDTITFKYRYRKQIIVGILIFLLIIGTTTSIIFLNRKDKKEEEKPVLVAKKEETTKTEEKEWYKVDIKGEVVSPGIYSLEKDKRVMDVIELAGGLTEQSDTSVINLSKKIQDEMVIIIYSREEVKEFEKTKEIEKTVQEKCNQKDENALINNACITKNEQTSGKISLNTATLEELMTLSGIGESKAKAIITYREENGPFQAIEEIQKVGGIGENLFAAIQEDITV